MRARFILLLLIAAHGAVAATARTAATQGAPAPLNILYYGNSFSMAFGTTPAIVEYLAEAAGFATPNTTARLVPGRDLAFHRDDPAQVAAIRTALPPGQFWDFVVAQGQSVEATQSIGNVARFRTAARGIAANVRAHSPAAKTILFQTWARAQGHAIYTGPNPPFANPLDMHTQLERGYTLATGDINQAFGPDTARRAACGETAALLDFNPAIYAADRYHQGPALALLSAMAIYTAVYQRPIGTLEPDFNRSSRLVTWLQTYNLDIAAWRVLAGIADRVAPPSLRVAPGSGDDLLLESGVAVPLDARATKPAARGQTITVRMTSPIGTRSGAAGWIALSWFRTGARPAPTPGLPEVQIDPGRVLFVAATPNLSQLSWRLPLTVAAPGWTLRFQGVVAIPSSKTGRSFTTTDGHDIRL